MQADGVSLVTNVGDLEVILFPIPGATPDGVRATLVNTDGARGMVTAVIHIAPGARIPAHWHEEEAEAHYVLEGDVINAGVSYGPSAFLTHPAGVAHGLRESRGGCKVPTLQTA